MSDNESPKRKEKKSKKHGKSSKSCIPTEKPARTGDYLNYTELMDPEEAKERLFFAAPEAKERDVKGVKTVQHSIALGFVVCRKDDTEMTSKLVIDLPEMTFSTIFEQTYEKETTDASGVTTKSSYSKYSIMLSFDVSQETHRDLMKAINNVYDVCCSNVFEVRKKIKRPQYTVGSGEFPHTISRKVDGEGNPIPGSTDRTFYEINSFNGKITTKFSDPEGNPIDPKQLMGYKIRGFGRVLYKDMFNSQKVKLRGSLVSIIVTDVIEAEGNMQVDKMKELAEKNPGLAADLRAKLANGKHPVGHITDGKSGKVTAASDDIKSTEPQGKGDDDEFGMGSIPERKKGARVLKEESESESESEDEKDEENDE